MTVQTTTPAVRASLPSPEQALVTASALQPERYARVIAVVAQTASGTPARVIVECDCGQTREVAVQDLFQVRRCIPCQDRAVREARKGRAKRRTASLRSRIAELEAKLAEQTPSTDDDAS